MHRDYEIMIAFRQAIKRDCKGRSTLSTIDFVRELDRLNWSYTLHATRYTLQTNGLKRTLQPFAIFQR